MSAADLKSELQRFIEQWPRLKQTVEDAYETPESEQCDEDDVYEIEPSTSIGNTTCTRESCKQCPLCCYKVLLKLDLLTDAYNNLGLAYKFLFTLPVSQVECERSFSALKRIKTRLRSTLTQEHWESFMLMSVEKTMLSSLSMEDIIGDVASSSKELHRYLSYWSLHTGHCPQYLLCLLSRSLLSSPLSLSLLLMPLSFNPLSKCHFLSCYTLTV